MKNLLWKLLVKPWVCPVLNELPTNILVVSTTGVGDTLWATPAIRALKNRFPHATLSVLTHKLGHELLQNSPHIANFHLTTEKPIRHFFSLLKTLKKARYDRIYIFHASQRPIFPLCALLGAPVFGTAKECKGLDWTLTHPIQHRPCHEIERRLDLLDSSSISDQKLDLFLTEEEKVFAQVRLKNLPKPIICIQALAKDGFKLWPKEHFIALGNRLPGTKLIIGSPDEVPSLAPIAHAIGSAQLMAGKLSIRHTAAVIAASDLMITSDTGPMHIAFAVNTPTLALFGPTDPIKCGPHHAKNVQILRAAPTCTPCFKRGCHAPFCMRQLSVDAVYAQAMEVLACR